MRTNSLVHFSMKYALLLAAVVVLAGCKKERIEEQETLLQQGGSVHVNIEAHLAQPENLQKAFLRGDSVEWEDGDVIRVNNQDFTVHRHEGGVGYFQGDANSFKSTFSGENHWFAVYPASIANQTQMIRDGSKAQICVTLPQTQVYQAVNENDASTCLKDMNYMFAYTKTMNNNSISLQFVNLCAVLKIGLKKGPTSGHGAHLASSSGNAQNSRVKKIVLYTSTNANASFWGSGYINSGSNTALSKTTDNLNDLPVIQIAMPAESRTNNNRKLILDCTRQRVKASDGTVSYTNLSNGVELTSSTTWFYIMVPINLTGGLTDMCMEVYDGNGNMMKKVLKNITVTKNNIYKSDLGQLQCQYSASSFIDADFSVDATHTVKFTSGNLQYQASTNTWKFASNQYTRLGVDKNMAVSSTNSGWIDLFGYGTSGNSRKGYDYSSSLTYPTGHISRTDDDWGWYNNISGHPKKAFFVWTDAQCDFVFNNAARKASKRFAIAQIEISSDNIIKGLFVFPDQYTMPDGVSWPTAKNIDAYNAAQCNYANRTYSTSDFNKMQTAGAVFLPCAGFRGYKSALEGTTVSQDNYVGSNAVKYVANYRCSVVHTNQSSTGCNWLAMPDGWNISNASNKIAFIRSSNDPLWYGRSVRLILSNY